MRFQHHPDGLISIDGYVYSLIEFLLDEPDYLLPQGMIGREYVQGKHHFLYDGTSQFQGEYPWVEGDVYLSKKQSYQNDSNSRKNPPLTLKQSKSEKTALLRGSCRSSIYAGFTSSALGTPHRYPLSDTDQRNMQRSVDIAQTRLLDITWTCKLQNLSPSETTTSYKSHTAPQAVIVRDDAHAHIESNLEKLIVKSTQLGTATNQSQVDAILW